MIGAGRNGGTTFKVDKTQKNPGFNFDFKRYNNNFYLLKIKGGEFTGITYATLSSTKLSEGAKVVAVSLQDTVSIT